MTKQQEDLIELILEKFHFPRSWLHASLQTLGEPSEPPTPCVRLDLNPGCGDPFHFAYRFSTELPAGLTIQVSQRAEIGSMIFSYTKKSLLLEDDLWEPNFSIDITTSFLFLLSRS